MIYNPVRIDAVDWAIDDNSRSVEHSFNPIECIVVGNLLRQDKEKVVVTLENFIGEETGTQRVRQTLAIPRQCVRKITPLTEKKRKK